MIYPVEYASSKVLNEITSHIFYGALTVGFVAGFCWGFVLQPLFF